MYFWIGNVFPEKRDVRKLIMLILLALLGGVTALSDKAHSQQGAMPAHHVVHIQDQLQELQEGMLSRFVLALQTTSMSLDQPLVELDEAVRQMVADLQADMDAVQ